MGNIYGPGDLNFNRVIPGTIRSILENKPPVLRSDGTPIREYFFVEDAVDAYLTMAESSGNMTQFGEAFNFSSGEKYSVLEVIRKILAVMESDLEPTILDSAKNEIHAQYLSIQKAKRFLKWRPRYTLDMGLVPTIQWYRSVFP
jgi:CDP-glucose 4,6-dehydratase